MFWGCFKGVLGDVLVVQNIGEPKKIYNNEKLFLTKNVIKIDVPALWIASKLLSFESFRKDLVRGPRGRPYMGGPGAPFKKIRAAAGD